MPIIVLLPTLGWSWPVLVPILSAAAGYLGYMKYTDPRPNASLKGKFSQQQRNKRTIKIPLTSYIEELVGEELGREEEVIFEKDGIIIVFRKNVRGKFEIQVIGPASTYTKELEEIGRNFALSIVQQFAHSKIARELESRGVHIVNEEVNENGEIVLDVRKWD